MSQIHLGKRSHTDTTVTFSDIPKKKRKLNTLISNLLDLFSHEHYILVKVSDHLDIKSFINLISICKSVSPYRTWNMMKEDYMSRVLKKSSKRFINCLNTIDTNIIPFLLENNGIIVGGSLLCAMTKNFSNIPKIQIVTPYRDRSNFLEIVAANNAGPPTYILKTQNSSKKTEDHCLYQAKHGYPCSYLNSVHYYTYGYRIDTTTCIKSINRESFDIKISTCKKKIKFCEDGKDVVKNTEVMSSKDIIGLIDGDILNTTEKIYFDGKNIYSAGLEILLRSLKTDADENACILKLHYFSTSGRKKIFRDKDGPIESILFV